VNETRLDKWLFCARFCRTRETAQGAIVSGRIRLNGTRVDKPGRAVHPGDVLTVALGGRVAVVKVLAPAGRRGSAPQARGLYETLPD
jgi:ribosome-associated heat shock protein Hsp15